LDGSFNRPVRFDLQRDQGQQGYRGAGFWFGQDFDDYVYDHNARQHINYGSY
jgi:hypothetical protein